MDLTGYRRRRARVPTRLRSAGSTAVPCTVSVDMAYLGWSEGEVVDAPGGRAVAHPWGLKMMTARSAYTPRTTSTGVTDAIWPASPRRLSPSREARTPRTTTTQRST